MNKCNVADCIHNLYREQMTHDSFFCTIEPEIKRQMNTKFEGIFCISFKDGMKELMNATQKEKTKNT